MAFKCRGTRKKSSDFADLPRAGFLTLKLKQTGMAVEHATVHRLEHAVVEIAAVDGEPLSDVIRPIEMLPIDCPGIPEDAGRLLSRAGVGLAIAAGVVEFELLLESVN